MYELDRNHHEFNKLIVLTPLRGVSPAKTPEEFPTLEEDELVVCDAQRAYGREGTLYVCEDLVDMKYLDEVYGQGGFTSITWLRGKMPGHKLH